MQGRQAGECERAGALIFRVFGSWLPDVSRRQAESSVAQQMFDADAVTLISWAERAPRSIRRVTGTKS